MTNPNSRAIIVCPSRELCAQTYQFLKILTSRCSDFISLYELGNETESDDVIGASIVMGTPGRLVKAIKGNRLVMKDVAVLVLDEGTGLINPESGIHGPVRPEYCIRKRVEFTAKQLIYYLVLDMKNI